MTKDHQFREAVKTLAWGILLTLGACCFWYGLCGNPLNELALIRRAQVTSGFIIDTWEDVEDGVRGEAHWYHGVAYTYRTPDGRDFTKNTRNRSGRLKEELRFLDQPYPVQIEYLPDNPAVSRIKGNGSDTITDWLWRKVGLGGLLLLVFLSPGFYLLQDGIRMIIGMKTE